MCIWLKKLRRQYQPDLSVYIIYGTGTVNFQIWLQLIVYQLDSLDKGKLSLFEKKKPYKLVVCEGVFPFITNLFKNLMKII